MKMDYCNGNFLIGDIRNCFLQNDREYFTSDLNILTSQQP